MHVVHIKVVARGEHPVPTLMNAAIQSIMNLSAIISNNMTHLAEGWRADAPKRKRMQKQEAAELRPVPWNGRKC